MPVYTYRCEDCGVRFDHTSKFSDPPLTRCPECGKKSLKKVYQPVGIVFKGSGFYATDHKSPSGGKQVPSSSESKSETSSTSAGESGSSAAPAASTGETKSSEKKD